MPAHNHMALDHFFEICPDFLCVLDQQTNFLRINMSMRMAVGDVNNELIGTKFIDLIHVEDQQHLYQQLDLVLHGSVTATTFNGRLINKHDVPVAVDWTCTTGPSQNIYFLVGRDTTRFNHAPPYIEQDHLRAISILENIHEAFYMLDKNWRFTYVNKVAEQHFNYTKAHSLIGKNIWHEFPRLVHTQLFAGYNQAMQKQTFVQLDFLSPYTELWYTVNIHPSQHGLSIYCIDTTKRKKFEYQLLQNHKRLKAQIKMNNMTQADIWDMKDFVLGEMLKLTGSQCGWLGFIDAQAGKVQLFSITDHSMQLCQAPHLPLELTIAEGGLWAQSIVQQKTIIVNDYAAEHTGKKGLPPGHIQIQRLLTMPVWDQGRIVMLAVVANKELDYNYNDAHQLSLLLRGTYNLLQRKNAEEQLRLSEQKFRYFFDNSLDGMLISRPDGTIISANPSFCRMLGRTEEQVCKIGRSGILDLADPKLNHFLQEREKVGLYQGEIDFIHRDGHKVPAEVTSKTYQVECGQKLVGTITRNLSEKIKTQQQILQLERLNLIGQLAAGIGHEVRNPLTVVRGFIQLLSDKEQYQSDKSYFNMILQELDRANSIITDFLSLARIKPTEMEKENLNDIIEGLYPLIQSDALHMDKNISFHPTPVPDILLNKKEIHQLILNLVRNGLEAMPPRGEVKISTFMREKQIIMSIQDTGSGIDQAVLDQLGTPFLTTKEQGTGLGLATCFSIAKRNNACINAQTGAAGTTFWVCFNLPEDNPDPS